jgi:ABC-type branched-subunit amino acid transport system substrate-binding protein
VPSLAREAARAGLLSVAPCNPEPRALRSVPRTWPVGVAGPQQAAQLATFARANNGTTAFVLSARGPRYLAALADDLEAAARRAGIRVVGRAEVALDGSNANAVAARIRSSRARGILTPIYAPHLTGIVSSLRSRGVRSIVYVTDGLDALAATDLRGVRRARSPLEDVVFVTQGFARPEAASFLREYRRRHPAAVDSSLPGLGYETVRVLRAAAGRARSVRPAALDNVFRAGFSVPGVALGDITYPGRGARAPVRTVGVARVVRSEYVPLLASVPSPAAVPPG